MDSPTPALIPTREQAANLDDSAEWPVIVPQWQTADGQTRGVYIRALTAQHRMDAERAATDKDGKVSDWRLIAEELRRGIVRPGGLTAEAVLRWNNAVVLYLHDKVTNLAPYLIPAEAEQALARILGPAPDPVEPGGASQPGGAA